MKTVFLLILITLSEATIGIFVKLTDGQIPIQTLSRAIVPIWPLNLATDCLGGVIGGRGSRARERDCGARLGYCLPLYGCRRPCRAVQDRAELGASQCARPGCESTHLPASAYFRAKTFVGRQPLLVRFPGIDGLDCQHLEIFHVARREFGLVTLETGSGRGGVIPTRGLPNPVIRKKLLLNQHAALLPRVL